MQVLFRFSSYVPLGSVDAYGYSERLLQGSWSFAGHKS